MNKRFRILHAMVIVVIGLIIIFCGKKANAQTLTDKAKVFIEQISNGDFAGAVKDFDNTMTNAMPADKLKATWESMIAQIGKFISQGDSRIESSGGYTIVYITCKFEAMSLDAKVIYDTKGKIAGLFFAPVQAKIDYQTPEYADASLFTEKDVTVGSGEWALPGTLTLPKSDGPFRGVVLVHGSGPNDRDETVGADKPFTDLAWGLASKGVAVLRYEKRTKVYAAKLANSTDSFTVKEETIDDAVLASELLRHDNKIDSNKVFVLGHSLGAMVIPRIAKADSKIAGFIIMAGPTRPLEDLIFAQMNYIASLDSVVSDDEIHQLKMIQEQVSKVKSPDLALDTPPSELPMGVPASYWIDLRKHDPAKEAKDINKPILILQGESDYQVTTEDFGGWKKALFEKKNVQFQLYPRLNHLFIAVEGRSTPSDYAKPGHVEKSVIEDIAKWIKQQ